MGERGGHTSKGLGEIEQASFTPLVLPPGGGFVKEATS